MNENPWLAASDNMTRGDWTIEDWREMSLFGCRNNPSNQCRKCHVHYCPQDISNQLHSMTDVDNSR
jgi:hypothetical protein